MFDEQGNNTWAMELDIYGQVKNVKGRRENCPFRYPGQYEDCETGLYYNRFRYYDPEVGGYVSQDPIGLDGDMPNFYTYVHDINYYADPFGLSGIGAWGEKVASKYLSGMGHQILGSVQNASGHGFDLITKTKDGFINVIEVKTSQSKWRSKAKMPQWTNRNINKILKNTNGFWSNIPNYQKNLMNMIRDANLNNTLRNQLLQINIDKRNINLKCK